MPGNKRKRWSLSRRNYLSRHKCLETFDSGITIQKISELHFIELLFLSNSDSQVSFMQISFCGCEQ